ncbi:tyrosyl-DNA phosphodiesterase 2 [Echinops telfairi]|uniref:Tyrosyl-DNA phosphodiesterase 2 n=1 Tax=Echinops telfairi TaxID=9371 RepID=A0ABM1VLJ0_ECHTE|nr:tyrosyl-DNA phosphodiesterase 2 [Echinops telfairi]
MQKRDNLPSETTKKKLILDHIFPPFRFRQTNRSTVRDYAIFLNIQTFRVQKFVMGLLFIHQYKPIHSSGLVSTMIYEIVFRSDLASVDLTKEETTDSHDSKISPPENGQQEDGSMFSLITWNIDGLDLNNLPERIRGVCSYLALYSPDVVFLQEVIPPYYSYLRKRATSYEIITGNEEGYFTAIMLKKSRVKLKSQGIVPFPSTKMMRNLLRVHVTVSGNDLCLMTSHLESTRGHAKERISQLQVVLKEMQEAPESATVIFAGDTNLRDQEVTKCGGLPENILDVWEFLGKPKHCQYTWDTQMNSNLGIPANYKLRFDRIFFRAAAKGGHIIPQSLDLLGLEKLDCGRFPSDHWGLLCILDVIL